MIYFDNSQAVESFRKKDALNYKCFIDNDTFVLLDLNGAIRFASHNKKDLIVLRKQLNDWQDCKIVKFKCRIDGNPEQEKGKYG